MHFYLDQIYCPKCGSKIDACIKSCPKCGTLNRYRPSFVEKQNNFWVETWKQLLIFVLGFIGFNIVGVIVQSCFVGYANIFLPNVSIEKYLLSAQVSILTNAISYTLILIIIILLLFPQLNDLFKEFKLKTILNGIGGGVLLIVFSFIYNLIISNFIPNDGNQNQQAIVSIITIYPFTSLILFGVVGPIVEEFTYRVGLFTFLNRLSRIGAYILTPLIFGFIHFDFTAIGSGWDNLAIELINIPNYIVAGLILCYIYEKNSWAGSTIAHIVNNSFSVLMSILAMMLPEITSSVSSL